MAENKIVTFDDYSKKLAELRTVHYPLAGQNMVYPALKLAGEAGELADKIGKHWRNTYAPKAACGALESRISAYEAACESMSAISITAEFETEVIKEMGDVLWYLNALCQELKINLVDVAEMNVQKLTTRKQNGTVLGVGDNR
jgi:NTP pyrophosphatase (non-canonical NTP hydrolase)